MVEKKLNVIFFPAWFPSKQNPLAGKFVLDHAKAISSYADISIVYIEPNSNLNGYFEVSSTTVDSFKLVKIQFRKVTNKALFFLNGIFYLTAVIYLLISQRNLFRRAKLNHVHVLTRAAILPYLIKLFYGIPYVISEHWSRYLPQNRAFKGFIRKTVTKFLLRRSNGVAAVSNNLKSALASHDLEHSFNFRVIYNVLDTDFYTPCISSRKSKLVLHVSGLNDDVKNVSGILRAAKFVVEKDKEVSFVIVGDDDVEGPIIRKYVTDLGLTNVIFKGKLYGSELLKYYQQAEVFVLNSNFDNQPYVLLEAMSCGVPVIATAVGGVPEMVTEETGILIPPQADNLLAAEILNMTSRERIFDSANIRKHVLNNYSYEKIGEDIAAFYIAALSKT